jgi:SAM-dependent methyltransferase
MDYDRQATRWRRDRPTSVTDFCVRPLVLELFRERCQGARVVDLGCGEGYFSRLMAPSAATVMGVDSSNGMLELARAAEAQVPLGIEYRHADVKRMPFLDDGSLDAAVGLFVTNYQTTDELPVFYAELARVLRAAGRFILAMPHPSLFFTYPPSEADSFPAPDYHYLGSRGRRFDGTLQNLRGETLEASVFHHSLEDHFEALGSAGLAVDRLREPTVAPDLAATHPLFAPLLGRAMYLVVSGVKLGPVG